TLLHGSRFEPFGLTPLYAMRYGTIPIGSKVGGMVDTIVDPGQGRSMSDVHNATGILFEGESELDMLSGIDRSIELRGLPLLWRTVQRNGMTSPMGWDRTAPMYVQVYQGLCPDVALSRAPERARAKMLKVRPDRQS